MVIDTKEDLQQAVLRSLKFGKANALPGKLLAQRLGERDTRQIRLTIIDLVEQGHPICSVGKRKNQPSGYYVAENAEEVKECLDQLMSYIKMLARHHKFLLRATRKLRDPYQIALRL